MNLLKTIFYGVAGEIIGAMFEGVAEAFVPGLSHAHNARDIASFIGAGAGVALANRREIEEALQLLLLRYGKTPTTLTTLTRQQWEDFRSAYPIQYELAASYAGTRKNEPGRIQ